MKLSDQKKTLFLFALHFAPAVPFIVAGALISWQEGAVLARAYGPPSWEGVRDVLLFFKVFVVIPCLAIIAAYIFCYRVKRRLHRAPSTWALASLQPTCCLST